jgi:acyl carrier protein
MTAVVLAPTRTIQEITSLTIELLADQLHQDPLDLRRELEANGSLMPVDSLDMFDILQEFRTRTGLTLPVRSLKRNTLRSVGAFADFVLNEAT